MPAIRPREPRRELPLAGEDPLPDRPIQSAPAPSAAPHSRVWRGLCLIGFAAASAAMLALVARTMSARLRFPFELSKMEGYLVEHMRWLAHGNPIYAAPSEQFIPFLYTPLAYWIGAPLMAAGVDGFVAARLVSLLGLAGAVAIGSWIVARATRERWLALTVPILFLARYFDVNSFYDHARADNLMALFAVGSLASLCIRRTGWAVGLFVAGGVLAFWTKQSSALLYAALLAGYALVSWRAALVAAIALYGLIFATFALADHASGGWLYAYTIDAPAYHTLDHWHLIDGLRRHIFGSFAIPTALTGLAAAAIALSGQWPRSDWDERARARYLAIVGGVAAGGFTVASLWQPISMENVLVLYAVSTSITVPIALSWGIEQLEHAGARAVAWNLALVLLTVVVLQGFRQPGPFHPSAADAETWRAFGRQLASYGPRERAWVMLHGSPWGGALDTPTSVHRGALCDLIGGYFGRPTRYAIPEGLLERIDTQYWDVVLVKAWDTGFREMLEGRYAKDPEIDGVRLPAFAGYGAAWEEYWIRVENPTAEFRRPVGAGPCARR